MEVTTIGSLVIVGAVVSVVVQFVKKFFSTNAIATIAIVVALSLAGGFLYVKFNGTEYWATCIQILTAAGAVYTYIIERFKSE